MKQRAPLAIPDDPVHEIRVYLEYRRIAIVNIVLFGVAQAGAGS